MTTEQAGTDSGTPATEREALSERNAAASQPMLSPLMSKCAQLLASGLTYQMIADTLNQEGIRTKRGKSWRASSVYLLLEPYRQLLTETPELPRDLQKIGKTKRALSSDLELKWVAREHPTYANWQVLASEWLASKEVGLGTALAAMNSFLKFLIDNKLSTLPGSLLRITSPFPDFYTTVWGSERTRGKIDLNNQVRAFLSWVLTRQDFCGEDDMGRLRTSPAFHNPVPYLVTSGIPIPEESVNPTLPYGYIDELRKTIAEGPHFSDWKWAQNALGFRKASKPQVNGSSGDDEAAIAPVWFEVPPSLIDRSDPDCVWRVRTRQVNYKKVVNRSGTRTETIYELWSPVRWVALLIKLQLPLRTLQVRLLDSGEGDPLVWREGRWVQNEGRVKTDLNVLRDANGVFRKPNRLIDGDTDLILYINTNKTADQVHAGAAKGYSVPWLTSGPIHQNPFYWLEKLRNWQEKYNPLQTLTSWEKLDRRHIPLKSFSQLAAYPQTAFLFRTPETEEAPHLPLAINALERPWYMCLIKLEKSLASRRETLPGGGQIRLVPEQHTKPKNSNSTLYPLHCLRVSLITALVIDGEVPLAIVQKIAGHSRLIMTIYYTKPGAGQTRRAIQAGVERLNSGAEESIIDWLATCDFDDAFAGLIANAPETVRIAVAEDKHLRTAAGWMLMIDGLCFAGGNNSEMDSPGCHNGGPNIGSSTAPRFTPVKGGARNCPMCRWFATKPHFLPQLAARWNNISYHLADSKSQVQSAENTHRVLEDQRANSLIKDEIFLDQRTFLASQRNLERCIEKFDALSQTLFAVTRLMERCTKALKPHEENALIAVGRVGELEYSVETVDSELLQVSGVCEGSILYPDLDAGKAVIRQSQILDAALLRDQHSPVFLTLTEEDQKLVGSAWLKELAKLMDPDSPALGRYKVISLIEAEESLRTRLGSAFSNSLQNAVSTAALGRKINAESLPFQA